MFIVCRAVNARKDSFLPTQTLNIEHTVEALISAISQQYKELDFPIRGKTLQVLLKGYFEVGGDGGKTVTSPHQVIAPGSANQKVQVGFEYAEQPVVIVNPLDVTTIVKVFAGGRETTVDTLAQEFEDAGVEMPKLEIDWKGDMGAKKREFVTPTKKKKETTPDKKKSAAPTSALSAAIKRRLSPAAKAMSESPKKAKRPA